MRFEEYTHRLSLGNTRVSSSKRVQIRRVLTLPNSAPLTLRILPHLTLQRSSLQAKRTLRQKH